MSPEEKLFEEIEHELIKHIDECLEEKEKEEHDEVLCSMVNALAFGHNIVATMISSIQEHMSHTTFVARVVDFIATFEPDLSVLRLDIAKYLQDKQDVIR